MSKKTAFYDVNTGKLFKSLDGKIEATVVSSASRKADGVSVVYDIGYKVEGSDQISTETYTDKEIYKRISELDTKVLLNDKHLIVAFEGPAPKATTSSKSTSTPGVGCATKPRNC